ncbi:dynein assembly factor [Chloropicon primus]|uniref:Dynein assembly factor n=1 Tax=Chloropicon primus TaxID=1764295 RepID=A0A5B8MY69_9CHLO|nr:dynein assembly factor [Chloropicon primus]UPR03740.1 dynein assembly factor [Chloropicon primus]|eukprot:QDZ24532.1 dynein assembly factor [Chloropicon primus]
MDKLGAHFLWGYSSALDLLGDAGSEADVGRLQVVQEGEDSNPKGKEIWALQVCAGDCRHVLRTLSSLFRGQSGQGLVMGFKIYEKEVELLARQMLLLHIALDTQVDLKERVELFLEVHGNLELTGKAEKAVDAYAKQLEDWITSLKPAQSGSLLRYFDVSELKYQEKDELLRVFKSWRMTKEVNAQALWDYRARKLYGDRYDFRKNLIDWDYHMRLSGKDEEGENNVIKSNKSIIHHVHFRRWRMSGNSHEFRDKKYDAPNRTLMSTIASRLEQYKDRNMNAKGASVSAYGYFGDIQNPPYSSFGLDSWDEQEKERLFKRVNKQFQHTAVDVSKANLSFFGKTVLSRVNSSGNLCACNLTAEDGLAKLAIHVVEQYKTIEEPMKQVRLKFSTGEKMRTKKTDPKYEFVIVGCRNAHLVKDMADLPSSTLYVEACSNLVEVTKEHCASFESKVKELAIDSSWSDDKKEISDHYRFVK